MCFRAQQVCRVGRLFRFVILHVVNSHLIGHQQPEDPFGFVRDAWGGEAPEGLSVHCGRHGVSDDGDAV